MIVLGSTDKGARLRARWFETCIKRAFLTRARAGFKSWSKFGFVSLEGNGQPTLDMVQMTIFYECAYMRCDGVRKRPCLGNTRGRPRRRRYAHKMFGSSEGLTRMAMWVPGGRLEKLELVAACKTLVDAHCARSLAALAAVSQRRVLRERAGLRRKKRRRKMLAVLEIRASNTGARAARRRGGRGARGAGRLDAHRQETGSFGQFKKPLSRERTISSTSRGFVPRERRKNR